MFVLGDTNPAWKSSFYLMFRILMICLSICWLRCWRSVLPEMERRHVCWYSRYIATFYLHCFKHITLCIAYATQISRKLWSWKRFTQLIWLFVQLYPSQPLLLCCIIKMVLAALVSRPWVHSKLTFDDLPNEAVSLFVVTSCDVFRLKWLGGQVKGEWDREEKRGSKSLMQWLRRRDSAFCPLLDRTVFIKWHDTHSRKSLQGGARRQRAAGFDLHVAGRQM